MKKYGWHILSVFLLVVVVILGYFNIGLSRRVDALRAQLDEYKEKEGKSYVVERISKQMEDIAYQQKDISEKQREEAVFQMGVAEQMRIRAEEEQKKAEAFSRNAVEARNMAENQRELAVQQQLHAEYARNVADTLSNVALGRALALLSNVQYRAGNKDVAALLAYASWKYTSKYKGNVYQPVIFNALGQTSESFVSRNLHKGGVTKIVQSSDGKNSYVSVSNYGEVNRWRYDEGFAGNEVLFSNPEYSFRDVYWDENNVVYALSYDGRMLVINGKSAETFLLPEDNGWMRIVPFGNGQLLLASAMHLYIYDKKEDRIKKTISLSEPLAALGCKENQWLAFGKENGLWRIGREGELVPQEHFIKEQVTAFSWSSDLKMGAVGVENGNIYLIDETGNVVKSLVGHRSRITQLEFKGQYLFSSSYDCTVSLWDISASKQEAVSLKILSGWVHCICMAEDNTIWTGDESGAVSRIMISPDEMAALIQSKLKRDFTDDEWSYYVGRNVPRIRLKLVNKIKD